MKTKFLSAAALAALLTATSAMAASGPSVSSGVATALIAAQKATADKKYDDALAEIEKAKAAKKTDYDDLKINEVLLAVSVGKGDMAAAAAAAEAAAAEPNIPDNEKGPVLQNALMLSLSQQHNDKALVIAKQVEATNPTDPRLLGYIAKAYFASKDYPGARAAAQRAIDGARAAHVAPDRDLFVVMTIAAQESKDMAGATAALEQMVLAYNSPDDWTQLIDVTLGTPGLRDVDAVYLGRLLLATGAKITPQQASIIGDTASRLTFYGDAEAAKEHGAQLTSDPAPKAAADQKSMPAQIAQSQKEKNGLLAAKTAQALYSYGRYPEAEAQARVALAKGGDPDASEPQLVLGMALAGQGKYADAIAAFQAVQGGGPAVPKITKLWIDYCTIKSAPPAPAAAAPAH